VLAVASGILGRLAIPLIGAYAQSKWALEAIAETLALEVGPLGIKITVLEPGMGATVRPRSAATMTTAPLSTLASGRGCADPG
jgi:NAD(P)-dependent dehydrogenase (short-subunit alcohol dehydrogenase family)